MSKKREEFWDTQWRAILHLAVLEENSSNSAYLVQNSGLRIDKCLLIQVYDATGQRYELPPYIISEPLRYGQGTTTHRFLQISCWTRLVVVRLGKYKDVVVNTLNDAPIPDIKAEFMQKTGSEIVRCFLTRRN